MTIEKARDFFSAYFEGTLAPGFRQALEREFAENAAIIEEYRAFEASMKSLDLLRLELIDAPISLHETIANRVEAVQRKRESAPVLRNWASKFAWGAIAVAAIVGAVLSIDYGRENGRALAGPIDWNTGQGAPSIVGEGHNVRIVRNQDSSGAVVISEIGTLHVQTLKGVINSTISNSTSSPAEFTLQVKGMQDGKVLVVPPSSSAASASTGTGDLLAFAKAISCRYGVPVMLDTLKSTPLIRWKLGSGDIISEADKAIGGSGYSVEIRAKDLVTITPN